MIARPRPGTAALEHKRAIVAKGAVTTEEAMETMAMSESTLRRYIKAGALPVIRYGRAIAIPRQAITDFMAERLVR